MADEWGAWEGGRKVEMARGWSLVMEVLPPCWEQDYSVGTVELGRPFLEVEAISLIFHLERSLWQQSGG